MAAVLYWFRLDVRRCWRSLLVLVLLIAFAAGTIMTAVAGARRGATAVDRLLDQTLPATVVVAPNQPGFDWDTIRALPSVASVGTFVVQGVEIDGNVADHGLDPGTSASVDMGYYPPADAESMHSLERPVVLDGRLADSTRHDEVVVTSAYVANQDKGIGDTVTLRMWEPETSDRAWVGDPHVIRADGPEVEATIVGIVRSLWFSDTLGGHGAVIPSAGLFAQYASHLVGARNSGFIHALVRLDAGEAAIPRFEADLAEVSRRPDIDVRNLADDARRAKDITGFEANGLLVFAVVASLASVVLVGLSIARYSASTTAGMRALSGVGMTAGQSRCAATVGPALAAVAGTVLGVASAVLASRWFPIGSAALLEPAPGFDVDWAVAAVVVTGVPVLVAACALAAARSMLRSPRPADSPKRSAVATRVGRLSVPAPVAVGTRFALESGRGPQAVPVRPALIGASAGVLGVIAALAFASGVDDAVANPVRFGQTYQLDRPVGLNGIELEPADELLPIIAEDPAVVAVNDTRAAVAGHSGLATTVMTLDPVGAPLDVVMTGGRLPHEADEIVLGPRTARAMGVGVGDRFRLTGTRATRELIVTGLAFVYRGPNNDHATGAWVTREAFDELFETFTWHAVVIALQEGADPEAAAARIGTAARKVSGGESFLPFVVSPPRGIAELRQVRALPLLLAGFLTLLALGAVGHALGTAIRRRRRDVAVLRALGMTRWQSRGVMITQANVLALVGIVVGVPLGVALGRTVWRYVADAMYVHYVPPVPIWALVMAAPVALFISNALAVWPSQRAASMRVGHVLRAE